MDTGSDAELLHAGPKTFENWSESSNEATAARPLDSHPTHEGPFNAACIFNLCIVFYNAVFIVLLEGSWMNWDGCSDQSCVVAPLHKVTLLHFVCWHATSQPAWLYITFLRFDRIGVISYHIGSMWKQDILSSFKNAGWATVTPLLRGSMSSFKNHIYLLPGSYSSLVEIFHLVCVVPFRGPTGCLDFSQGYYRNTLREKCRKTGKACSC